MLSCKWLEIFLYKYIYSEPMVILLEFADWSLCATLIAKYFPNVRICNYVLFVYRHLICKFYSCTKANKGGWTVNGTSVIVSLSSSDIQTKQISYEHPLWLVVKICWYYVWDIVVRRLCNKNLATLHTWHTFVKLKVSVNTKVYSYLGVQMKVISIKERTNS